MFVNPFNQGLLSISRCLDFSLSDVSIGFVHESEARTSSVSASIKSGRQAQLKTHLHVLMYINTTNTHQPPPSLYCFVDRNQPHYIDTKHPLPTTERHRRYTHRYQAPQTPLALTTSMLLKTAVFGPAPQPTPLPPHQQSAPR